MFPASSIRNHGRAIGEKKKKSRKTGRRTDQKAEEFRPMRNVKLRRKRTLDSKEKRSIADHCRSIQFSGCTDGHLPFRMCKLCGNRSIRYYKNGHVQLGNVLRHVLRHLSTTNKMYACRHCQRETRTRDGMYMHIWNSHGINKEVTLHFDDRTENYADDIKLMMTKCFGDENNEEGDADDVEEAEQIDEATLGNGLSQIEIHCRIIQNNGKNGLFPFRICNLCGNQSIRYWKGLLQLRNVLRHVSQHLDLSVYACSHCEFKTTTRDSIYCHVRRRHDIKNGVPAHFEDRTGQFATEINSMITLCFGRGQRGSASASSSATVTKRSASNGVSKRNLPTKRWRMPRFANNSTTEIIRVHPSSSIIQHHQQQDGRVGSSRILQLPIIQVRKCKKVYSCSLCGVNRTSAKTMRVHLALMHRDAIPPSDDEEDYEEGNDQDDGALPIESSADDEETAGDTQSNDGVIGDMKRLSEPLVPIIDLAGQRNQLCATLFQRYSTSGAIKCQLCTKMVPVAGEQDDDSPQCSPMILHAEFVHLKQLLYGCRQCQRRFSSMHSLQSHWRRENHGTTIETDHDYCGYNSFEYFADQYHDEIVAQLRKCYENSKGLGLRVIKPEVVEESNGDAFGVYSGESGIVFEDLVHKEEESNGDDEGSGIAIATERIPKDEPMDY